MDKRKHFRVSDFIAVEIYDGEKRVFPAATISPNAVVQALHGDLLNAVIRGLKRARTTEKVGTAQLIAILSDELTNSYIKTECVRSDDRDDPRRCHVSLSEGGVRIDVSKSEYTQPVNSKLTLKLYLADNDKALQVQARLRGNEEIDGESMMMLRFEFTGLPEFSRQRLFRYILKQQARKVRTASVGNCKQS